jgi:hypothetical protein
LIFWAKVVWNERFRPRRDLSLSLAAEESEPEAPLAAEVDAGAAEDVDEPPTMPAMKLEVFEGVVEAGAAGDEDGEAADGAKEKDGEEVAAVDAVVALVDEAAGLAAPKPVNPPNGLAFAGG